MLKCNSKSPKFKNLTVGKDYEGTIEGEFAEITNDLGAKAKYNKKYFTETPGIPVTPQRRPVPQVHRMTMTEFVNRFVNVPTIDESEDRYEISLEINNIETTFEFYINNAENSCALKLFDGMNTLMNMVNNHIPRTFTAAGVSYEISDYNEAELFILIFEKILMRIEISFAFLIATTTRELGNRMLDLLSTKPYLTTSPIKLNPNSGNNVCVWVIAMESFTS